LEEGPDFVRRLNGIFALATLVSLYVMNRQ
jgi:hypothetical protein